jgi:hypothetical protein
MHNETDINQLLLLGVVSHGVPLCSFLDESAINESMERLSKC